MSETKWMPNEREKKILLQLKTEIESEGGQSAFARLFPKYKSSTLSKILAALDESVLRRSYFDDVQNVAQCFADLETFVSKIPKMREDRRANARNVVHALKVFSAVLNSVHACMGRATPVRITKYIAGTGGGKSTLREYLRDALRDEVPFHAIEARQVWKPTCRDGRASASLNMLRDVASGLGMDVDDMKWTSRRISEREDEICARCNECVRVLFIDEAEFFHTYSLNFFKWLLNKSMLVLVVACSPTAHAKWNYYFEDEALQIARRTNGVISLGALSAEDVNDKASHAAWELAREDAALFFPANQFASPVESLSLIVTESRRFGLFELIAGVAKRLQDQPRATIPDVVAAIRNTHAPMGKKGGRA